MDRDCKTDLIGVRVYKAAVHRQAVTERRQADVAAAAEISPNTYDGTNTELGLSGNCHRAESKARCKEEPLCSDQTKPESKVKSSHSE